MSYTNAVKFDAAAGGLSITPAIRRYLTESMGLTRADIAREIARVVMTCEEARKAIAVGDGHARELCERAYYAAESLELKGLPALRAAVDEVAR